MKRLNTFAFILSYLLTTFAAAQEKVGFSLINFPTGTVNNISPNGKWTSGGRNGSAYLYNTESGEVTDLSQIGMVIIPNAVSDNGIIVADCGPTAGFLSPAYYQDEEWIQLENLGNEEMGNAFSITADGTKIGGCVQNEGTDIPCLWTLQGNIYKAKILPYPEQDIFGMKPQGTLVTDMSADGSTLAGRFIDWSGMYPQVIVWKLNSEGKYDYQVLGTDQMYNLEAENPGQVIEYKDIVTADPDTPEYYEQKEKFNELYTRRQELMDKFYKKFNFDVTSLSLNEEGNYLAVNINIKDPENKDDESYIYCPYRVNLKDNTNTIFQNCPDFLSCSITGEGLIMATSPNSEIYLRDAYILENNQTEPYMLSKWLSDKYSYDINKDISHFSNEGFMGTAFLSQNEKYIYAFATNINIDLVFTNYCLQLPSPLVTDEIKTIEGKQAAIVYANRHKLYINTQAQRISILDISGKNVYEAAFVSPVTDLSYLPQGIYLVKVKTPNQILTTKIMITD